MPTVGRLIRVRGTVQGVGFRPTVWRLAMQCGVCGQVSNDAEGVLIRAWAGVDALDEFVRRVRSEAPALARIDAVESTALAGGRPPSGFAITHSVAGSARTAVAPDAATCAECLHDIRDHGDRRHGYAFTNCTQCGPRLTILRRVPYDRDNTTMGAFAMCPRCRSEYDDPRDRRFHAQPTACPACGPQLWLEDAAGRRLPGPAAAALQAARTALSSGRIVAVKGLGGFHLACDALDADAVARLRSHKRRDGKPLALMARDLDVVRRFCSVSPLEAALLSDTAAPIVILPVLGSAAARVPCRERVADGVAPGVVTLGFLLPHTPLHHLLLEGFHRPLVMTSGNLADEPPCTANDEARQRLGPLVDLLLMHDRDIANRVDDSVLRVVGGAARMLRRARGHAPAPLRLPAGFEGTPDILALGAELKSSFCLVRGGEAIVSQHIGDLESAAAHADYCKQLGLFAAMFDHRPVVVAVDLHPDYASTRLGHQRADDEGLPLVGVQHHHAHLASVLAESGRPLGAPRVLGIALDGLGYGSDASLWGGEFLLADYAGFERLARLTPVAMPGGAQATREPWRSAYAHLCAARGWSRVKREFGQLDVVRFLDTKPLAAIDSMREAGVNSPLASSCGRLFDAVAVTLGICRERARYEAQAAIELEALAAQGDPSGGDDGYPFALTRHESGLLEIDPAPMWRALLADLARGAARADAALRFHVGLAATLVRTARHLAGSVPGSVPGSVLPGAFDTVALSGGVFQNALLSEAVQDGLEDAGFVVLTNHRFPSHDGGISLGQAAVAAARTLASAGPTRSEFPCA